MERADERGFGRANHRFQNPIGIETSASGTKARAGDRKQRDHPIELELEELYVADADGLAGKHSHPTATAMAAFQLLGLQRVACRGRERSTQAGTRRLEQLEVGCAEFSDDSKPGAREDPHFASVDRAG